MPDILALALAAMLPPAAFDNFADSAFDDLPEPVDITDPAMLLGVEGCRPGVASSPRAVSAPDLRRGCRQFCLGDFGRTRPFAARQEKTARSHHTFRLRPPAESTGPRPSDSICFPSAC